MVTQICKADSFWLIPLHVRLWDGPVWLKPPPITKEQRAELQGSHYKREMAEELGYG
jgi:hypothetical protein